MSEICEEGIDVWCLPETWLRGDIPSLPGLRRSFGAPRPKRVGKRGGVAQLVADGLECQPHVWKCRPADGVLWLRYRNIPCLSADLLAAVCYLPPNRGYNDVQECFLALEQECVEALAAGLVLIAGDFNAHTGSKNEVEGDTAPPPGVG